MNAKLSKYLKIGGVLAVVGSLSGASILVSAYYYLTPKLPEVDSLLEVNFQVPMRVYTADHKLMAEFGERRRYPLEYNEFPQQLIHAIVASEDEFFFTHPGVAWQGLARAVVNVLKTGRRTQGGSTITMQVARNFFLTRERSYLRKLNEIFLAIEIDKRCNASMRICAPS